MFLTITRISYSYLGLLLHWCTLIYVVNLEHTILLELLVAISAWFGAEAQIFFFSFQTMV